MTITNFISKEDLLKQLNSQIEYTGIWWESEIEKENCTDFSSMDYEFKHLVVKSNQKDYLKIYDICLNSFCEENKIDFISESYDSEIEFLHVTSKSNLDDIKSLGLIHINNDYIPDLGEGIYAVDINSSKGLDNLKTYLVDFKEDDILIITGTYNGRYNYCIKGEGHEGYLVLHDEVKPESLSFEIKSLNDFFFEY